MIQIHRPLLRQGDGDTHILAVQGHIRAAGGGGQSRSHLHIHLRHGHAVLHGLGPVHRQVNGGRCVVQAVGHGLHALHGADGLPHGFGRRLQVLHILAVDPQGNAAAGHHLGHIVRRAGVGHLALHIPAQLHDPPAGGVAALPLGDDDIGGDVIRAGAAVHARHGHAHAGGHGRAHGLHVFNGHGPAGHLVRQLRRLFIAAALGHGDGDADGVQVDLRHEHEAPLQRQQRRAHQQHHRRPQHHGLVPQGPGHGPAVAGIDLIQQAGLDGLLLFQHPCRHGRHQGQGNDQAGQKREGHGQSQVREQLLGDALHKHDGQEHAHGGQGGGSNGPQHLARAGHRRLANVGPLGAQAINILNDHHGVIHQHAHRHGQARQGDHVDGDAGEVHQHHGEDHADGDGAQGDHRGPQVPQEQVQDQHREQRAPAQRRQNGVDDKVYVVPLVHQGHEGKPLVLRLQLPEAVVDVVGHLRRGVGRLLVEGDDDAVLAVELVVDLRGVVGDGHVGHVLHADGVDAVHPQVKEHQILQVLPGVDGIAHGDHVVDAVLLKISGGHGEVLGRQQGGDGG